MTTLIQWAETLEATQLGVAIAESRYAFAIIEGLHLIGLSVSVGLIFLTDLRLLGLLFKHVPVRDFLIQLRWYVLVGFALIFLSGGLLFVAEASTLLASPPFAFKVGLIFVGGANALYFEFVIAKQSPIQEGHAVLPRNVKWAGATSLVSWTLVIICGRLIPYIPAWF